MNISNDEQINLQTHSESIVEFVSKYKAIKEKSGKGRKLDSVEKFRKAVEEDPVLRMQFQGAIDQIPEELPSFDVQGKMRPAILYQSNIDEAMDLLNLAAQTPPFYTRCELSAVPIATIVLDLINTELGKTLISRPDVNSHLKNIFNDYREMLTTEESLLHLNGEEKGWFSAGALKQVDYADYVCDPEAPHYGFKCWNDWFIRDLAKGARPVDGENDPSIITHAAENYPLTSLTLPARNIKTSDQFWLKENRYSLYDMFSAQKMGVKQIVDESFVGGTVYQGYLSPWCYHQWHSPVSGIVQRSYSLEGMYFLQNPSLGLDEPNNYKNSQVFLSCVNARHVVIINTKNDSIGRVALILIGMGEISACVSKIKEGDAVEKGQCIGRFEFGGSSHVIVFDRRANLQFNPKIHDRQPGAEYQTATKQRINTWLARVVESS